MIPEMLMNSGGMALVYLSVSFTVLLGLLSLGSCIAWFISPKARKWFTHTLSGRSPPLLADQRGAINIAGLMMMGIAMIFLAVGFIIYPVVIDATDTIMDYTYTGTANYTIADFTGLESVAGIVPLITLLGFVVSGAISGFMGYKMVKSGTGSLNPGDLMMLAIGLIFISVALIIFPVVLDGVATVLDSSSVDSYTGLEPVLGVTPLMVLVAFLAGGIVSSFFGIKKMAARVRGD